MCLEILSQYSVEECSGSVGSGLDRGSKSC